MNAGLCKDVFQGLLQRHIVQRLRNRHILCCKLRQFGDVLGQFPGIVFIGGMQFFPVVGGHGIWTIDNLVGVNIVVKACAV